MTENYAEEIKNALGNALGINAENFSAKAADGDPKLLKISTEVTAEDLPNIEKRAELVATPQIEQLGNMRKVTFTVVNSSQAAVNIQLEGQTALRNRIAEDLVVSTCNMGVAGKAAQKRVLELISRDLGLEQIQRGG